MLFEVWGMLKTCFCPKSVQKRGLGSCIEGRMDEEASGRSLGALLGSILSVLGCPAEAPEVSRGGLAASRVGLGDLLGASWSS